MTVLARLLDLALLPAAEVPHSVRAYARLSLFDWMVCGRAGRHEPLAGILRAMANEEGGTAQASMIGGGIGSGAGGGSGEWCRVPRAGL